MIHVSVTGDAEVAKAFARAGSQVRQHVDAAVRAQGEMLRMYIINQELSGQMLKVRTGKRRTQIVSRVRQNETTTQAEIHPSSGSVLWAIGSGMAPRQITVARRSSRVQRRAARAMYGRKWKAGLRKMTGTYRRTHRLQKVPFMEAAFASHRAQMRGAIEAAVIAGMGAYQGDMGGGEGI